MLRSNTSCFTTRRTLPPPLGSSFPVFLRPLRGRPGSLTETVPSSTSLRACLQLSTTDIVAHFPVAPRLVCSSAKISSSCGSSSSTSQQDYHQDRLSSELVIILFRYMVVEACFPSLPSTNRARVMKDFLKDDLHHGSRNDLVKKIRNILTRQLLPNHGEASIDDFAFAVSKTLKQASLSNEKMATNVTRCFSYRFRIPSDVLKELMAEALPFDERFDLYRIQLAEELLPHLRVGWDFCRNDHKKMFPWGHLHDILLS